MEDNTAAVETDFVNGMGQLADFWGHNKMIGWIYGLLYLREEPVSLDEIAQELGVSKGNVSLNVREAERLSMVRKVWKKGDRKDYYEAEPNLWRIVRQVTRERQKKEFDYAISLVGDNLEKLEEAGGASRRAQFARKRLSHLSSFLKSLNALVNGLLSLETLKGAAVQACPVRSRLPRLKGKS